MGIIIRFFLAKQKKNLHISKKSSTFVRLFMGLIKLTGRKRRPKMTNK